MTELPERKNHVVSGYFLTVVLVASVLTISLVVGLGLLALNQRSQDLCNVAKDNRNVVARIVKAFEDSSVKHDPRFEEARRILQEKPPNC